MIFFRQPVMVFGLLSLLCELVAWWWTRRVCGWFLVIHRGV